MQIEPARAHDLAHVYDTWIKGYRESPRTCRWPLEVYQTYQRAVIERLLVRSSLIVARPDDWPEGIDGWLCAEQQPDRFVVHFGATKPHLRGQGVLTSLLTHAGPTGRLVFSHLRPPYTETLKRRGYVHDRRAIDHHHSHRVTDVRDP